MGTVPKQIRRWLAITPNGLTSSMEISKLRVHHQLGIQLRDLRLLDPLLANSYPSAILARERALIVNLEFIKMIVGMDRVFITNLDDPNTTAFVEELQRRLQHPAGSATAMGVSPSTAALGASLQPMETGSHADLHRLEPGGGGAIEASSSASVAGGGGAPLTLKTTAPSQPALSTMQHPSMWHGPLFGAELPFELRVLECSLDIVSGYLEAQATDLEAAAHPALDALTKKITTGNLERVRRIKNRLVRLITKVETIKELMEKLLDDDSDMKDLNLSAKEAEREEMMQRQSLRHQSLSLDGASTTPFDVPLPSSGLFSSGGGGGGRFGGGVGGNNINNMDTSVPMTPASPRSVSESSGLSDDEDVEVVEQLLEAYFINLDNTYNKLQTLDEYIDDTDDFIQITLDASRNQLIKLDLLLTAFTASMGLITAISGMLAMNTFMDPENSWEKAPYTWFVTVACTSSALAIVLFISVVLYCRWKRLF